MRSKTLDCRYLVLGITGQLGHELAKIFRESDELFHKTREALDVTDLATVREQIPALAPTVVINATSLTGAYRCNQQREAAWLTNALAVDNLVKTCAMHGIPLIHVSDAEVFGQNMRRPEGFREVDPVCPVNWYASTKAAGEQAILGLSQCMQPEYWDYGFRYWLIRTGTLFERPWRKSDNLPYRIMERGLGKRNLDNCYPTPDAIQRSVTYAPDLANTIAWIARNYREVVSGVYHVANDGASSLAGLATELSHVSSRRLDVRHSDVKTFADAEGLEVSQIPRDTRLDCSKWNDIAPEVAAMPHWREAVSRFVYEFQAQ